MKKILKHLINFVLTITIFTFTIILIFKTTVLNEKYVLKTLENNYYYDEIYKNVVANFENNLIQSGIDEAITKDLISKDKVERDVKNVIIGIYNNKEIVIDSAPLIETLNNKIDEVFKGYHRTPNKEEQENIKRLESAIKEVYEDEIAYELNTDNLGESVAKIDSLTTTLLIIIGLISVVLLVIDVLFMNDPVNTMGIAILSTGLTITIIRIIIGSKYKNILMFNEIFSEIVVSVVTNFLTNILVIGIYLSIIGLILLIIGVYKKSFLNNEVRKVK